ncbi:MAG: M20/M25/M40 family metallo-hydrolase [Chloroflexi bacterium]|nr:M20/M25/M40 family metallo-hydrolase [Chloroflexota bacterium]
MINQERLVKTFCDLVRIDSPSGEEEAVAAELTRRLVALGFKVMRDAHGNLVASEPGRSPLLLSVHMDTVEPGRGIKPNIEGDTIVTDGTTVLGADDKAGIAAILEALESTKEDKASRIPVQVVLSRDEERGLVGAKNLDFSLLTAREAVVLDGQGPVSRITSGSPTYFRFDVNVVGRGAHAGVEPEKGVPAIRIAAEIIAKLPQGRLDEETTANVGLISGGTARNAVPSTASFLGELRSRNPRTLARLRRRFDRALETARARHPEATIEVDTGIEFEMYTLTSEDPIVQRVTRALEGVGLRPKMGLSGGGTDANILREHGIASVVVGVGDEGAHTVQERVHISKLVDVARFCEALIRQP